jgi:hypothetical protein
MYKVQCGHIISGLYFCFLCDNCIYSLFHAVLFEVVPLHLDVLSWEICRSMVFCSQWFVLNYGNVIISPSLEWVLSLLITMKRNYVFSEGLDPRWHNSGFISRQTRQFVAVTCLPLVSKCFAVIQVKVSPH